MIAACRGHYDIFINLLRNKTVDINCVDSTNMVNSFWLASYYGHGDIVRLLGNSGANILSVN